MKFIRSFVPSLAVVTALVSFALMSIDITYRLVAGGWWDHRLQTMRGWETIADENPRVIAGIIHGMFTVVVEDGTVYDVNLSAEPELRTLLSQLAE